MAAWWRYR